MQKGGKMKYKIIIDRAEKEIEADTLYDASIIAAELAEQVTTIEEVKDADRHE